MECGIILAQWSPESLHARDSNGRNPVQISVARGFVKFASELEKIQQLSRVNPPSFSSHPTNMDPTSHENTFHPIGTPHSIILSILITFPK